MLGNFVILNFSKLALYKELGFKFCVWNLFILQKLGVEVPFIKLLRISCESKTISPPSNLRGFSNKKTICWYLSYLDNICRIFLKLISINSFSLLKLTLKRTLLFLRE